MRTIYQIIIPITSLLILVAFQNCENFGAIGESAGSNRTDLLSVAEKNAIGVLKTHCAGCHNGSESAPEPVDILNFYQLATDGYISMGYPQKSLLYLDMIDGLLPHEGQPELSDYEIETIRTWLLGVNATADDLTGGGPTPGDSGSTAPAKFSEVFAQIIRPRCLGCHSAGDARGSLANYNAVRAQVVPGNPNASELYNRVVTNNMPQGAAPLSAAQKFMIQSWIQNGARND